MSGPPYHGRTHGRFGTDPTEPWQRMPWILLQGNLNGFTAVNGSDSYPNLTGLIVSPLNGGGDVDDTVFGGINTGGTAIDVMTTGSSNEPFKAIEILQPGLYMYEFSMGWYLDWGAVRVNYDVTHSDIDTSVQNFRVFVNGTENSYFGGFATTTSTEVHARSILAVDERATDVQVRGFVRNSSGSNRTYDNATRSGSMGLFIVQLSSSGDSNP